MTRTLLALAALALTGCGPAPDSPVHLGAQRMLGYHVRAGAASLLPDGDIGFVVTANGQGGYRVAWAAYDGSTHVFSGTINSDGTFDSSSVLPLSGRETITLTTDAREIDVGSTPGAAPDGVDFVPSVDPIYVDLLVDGAPAHVYFTGADTGRLYLSSYDPVAFTSP